VSPASVGVLILIRGRVWQSGQGRGEVVNKVKGTTKGVNKGIKSRKEIRFRVGRGED